MQQQRFIPAGAGNTLLMTILWEKVIIYPRWRGEHTVLTKVTRPPITLSPLARGTLCTSIKSVIKIPLSPLARGTHRGGAVSRAGQNFIPAGAGNTH